MECRRDNSTRGPETDDRRINNHLELVLGAAGIKVGRQNYTYFSAGERYGGENIYGILQAPRGDATEAIVLVAGWTGVNGLFNANGVALALTLARYFKRTLTMIEHPGRDKVT